MRKLSPISTIAFLLFILFVTLFIILPDKNHTFIKLTPSVNHQILLVALFFINIIISIFMFMSFIINKKDNSVFLLGLSFFSGLVYFTETIFIIQKTANEFTEIQTNSERIAVFYFFRQLNFVLLLSLAVYISNNKPDLKNAFKDNITLILGIVTTISLPLITYYVCNSQYYLFLKNNLLIKNELEWEIVCIKSVIALWSLLLLSVTLRKVKLEHKFYTYISLLCFTSILCNII
ncbi:hypothetical protein F3Y86_18710, partial [Salmonella enterica]|nr:hypothetical protein [Salmonella enterica]